jgi:hypothetical protein
MGDILRRVLRENGTIEKSWRRHHGLWRPHCPRDAWPAREEARSPLQGDPSSWARSGALVVGKVLTAMRSSSRSSSLSCTSDLRPQQTA